MPENHPVANPNHIRTATVIPVYRPDLTSIEYRRVEQTLRNVALDSVFVIGPQRLDVCARPGPLRDLPFIPFHDENFTSVAAYNRFMLRPNLYATFINFEFVLVCQTDAILVHHLSPLDAWQFDYLGAPWEPPWVMRWSPTQRRLVPGRGAIGSRSLHVGNGGLSLRRTSRFARLGLLPAFKKFPNEDIAISYFHRRLGVRIAPTDVAEKYFMETGARAWQPGDPVPSVIGFHGLDRHNPQLEAQILRRD